MAIITHNYEAVWWPLLHIAMNLSTTFNLSSGSTYQFSLCWCFDWLHFAKASQPDAGLRCCSITVQHTDTLFSCRIFISNLSQDLLQLYIQARASGQDETYSASFIEVGQRKVI
ncbi:unnamed protein product [Trifolium pratense]|uniref:Uncharacterized protein n=1 Tax=Trifolium pratense TaxID=57577 RepID=A0ACB0J2I1_TRIPR|nr:unnamed protein product [Trifolium pratense]